MILLMTDLVQYQYVYTKASMSVTDSGAYGALAVYSDYGKSSLVTVNTNVVSKYMLNILII